MMYMDETRCTGCGECVEVCPTDAIHLEKGVAVIDQAECSECEVCLGACPEGAILSVSEPVAEEAGLPAVRPVPEVIRIRVPPLAERRASEVATVPWRARVLPVVGAALAYVGRELPRIVPAVLDALERRPTRQPEVPAPPQAGPVPASTEPISAGRGRGGGGRRHRQRRRGQ